MMRTEKDSNLIKTSSQGRECGHALRGSDAWVDEFHAKGVYLDLIHFPLSNNYKFPAVAAHHYNQAKATVAQCLPTGGLSTFISGVLH